MGNGVDRLKAVIYIANAIVFDSLVPAKFQLVRGEQATNWGDLSILTITPGGIRAATKLELPMNQDISIKVRFTLKSEWEIIGDIVDRAVVNERIQYAVRWNELNQNSTEKLHREIVLMTGANFRPVTSTRRKVDNELVQA